MIRKVLSRVRSAIENLKSAYAILIRNYGYRLYGAMTVHAAKVSRYHLPLPQLSILEGHPTSGGRGQTASRKWQLIDETLPEGITSALDVGCNNGFFALNLAARGVFTLALDPNRDLLNLGQLAAMAARIDKVAFCPMAIDPDSVRGLPQVDVTLVLSVMHYWIQEYGWNVATDMLSIVWGKTRRCLYFEIPNPCENTKLASELARMGKTEGECREFIRKTLVSLGSCKARYLDYLVTDFRGDNERRHIFMAERVDERVV